MGIESQWTNHFIFMSLVRLGMEFHDIREGGIIVDPYTVYVCFLRYKQ